MKPSRSFLVGVCVFNAIVAQQLAAPTASAAPTAPLTATEIRAFQKQLDQARKNQANVPLDCLKKQDERLTLERDAEQVHLGELRRKENNAQQMAAKAEQATTDSQNALRLETNRLEAFERDFRQMSNKRLNQAREFSECMQAPFVPAFICAFRYSLDEIDNRIHGLDDQIKRTRRSLEEANKKFISARTDAEQSFRELLDARDKLESVKKTAAFSEARVVLVDLTLSQLRVVQQRFQDLLGGFKHALDAAASVTADDDRARTARMVRDLAHQVDGVVSEGDRATANARAALPQDITEKCLSH